MKYYVTAYVDTVGTFDSFEAALECYRQQSKDDHPRLYSSDCDYGTDTGWYDGLTEEQRDLL